MKLIDHKLIIEQADRKLKAFGALKGMTIPHKGWIHTVRQALNMSMRQLGKKLNMSAQSVGELETREAAGNITINSLKEAGLALDMKLVYGFIPMHGSIEQMLEERAYQLATEIVMRTSQNMSLEDQKNSKTVLKKAIKNKMEELKQKRPKYLWDDKSEVSG